MTDLEITKLCAMAMFNRSLEDYEACVDDYDPLHDDAQAMALIAAFKVHAVFDYERGLWHAATGRTFPSFTAEDVSINGAVARCVAKMQTAKSHA